MASHDNPGHIAIRTKQYKLILFYGAPMNSDQAQTPPGWELYDLKRDPTEDNNVYDNPEYAGVIKELKKQLKERRSELGEDDPEFAFNKVIDEFWEYDDESRAKAIEISNDYLTKRESGEILVK